MIQIKGILFDKDGTLIDFHSVWLTAARELIAQLTARLGQADNQVLIGDLLHSIGIVNEEVLPHGVLAGGTSYDIEAAFRKVLSYHEIQQIPRLREWISDSLAQITKQKTEMIVPTANLDELFTNLRTKGIKFGIATADDWEATDICLKTLGIGHYFEFIATADRLPEKKPHPNVLFAFCQHFGLEPEEVAVVGDTAVDLTLAKLGQAGLAIGVLSGVSSTKDLAPLADIIIPSVNNLIDQHGICVWERNTCIAPIAKMHGKGSPASL